MGNNLNTKFKKIGNYYIQIGLRIVIVVLLLICITNVPYSFYEFAKLSTFLILLWILYSSFRLDMGMAIYLYIVFIVLVNPLFPISLTKESWIIVDIVISGYMIFDIIKIIKWKEENIGSDGNRVKDREEVTLQKKKHQYKQKSIVRIDNIEELKTKLKFLEIEISIVDSEILEINRQINLFENLYHQHLGALLSEIFKLRQEKYANYNSDEEREKYESAKKNYEDYKKRTDKAVDLNIRTLSKDQEHDIKSMFKQACKLCHPDKVDDEHKVAAQEVFVKLKEAYEINNIDAVRSILSNLQQDIFKSGSESISDEVDLKNKITALEKKLKELKQQLESLRKSEAFITVTSISDFEVYFEKQKAILEKEIISLHEE